MKRENSKGRNLLLRLSHFPFGSISRTSSRTKAVVGAMMTAISQHDMKKIESYVSDNVDWFVPGIVPWAGRHSKASQIHDFFEKLGESIIPSESKSENFRIIVSGEDAILFNKVI